MALKEVLELLYSFENPTRAVHSMRYFKCGLGEYGHGDKFMGATVPQLRHAARRFQSLSFSDLSKLLKSKIHEERLLALLVLVHQYKKAAQKEKKQIVEFYLKNRKGINNWDLVDTSAGYILGDYLREKPKTILYRFARSNDLWEKRISIISTMNFIAFGKFGDTLKITKILMKDEHDLIHKACGWMLREVGKKNLATEKAFLAKNYKKMPRTMLRYAIEKFPETERQRYLRGMI